MKYLSIAILVSSYFIHPAFARITTAPPSIEYRFEQVTAVCIGSIESLDQINASPSTTGQLQPAGLEIMVHVEKDYKGVLTGDIRVLIASADPMGTHKSLIGHRYIFFIIQLPSGLYSLAGFSGSMPMFFTPVSELSALQGTQGLQTDILIGINSANSDTERKQQLLLLSQFRILYPATESLLNDLWTNSSSKEISTLSLAILARSGSAPKGYAHSLIGQIANNPNELYAAEISEVPSIVATNTDEENLPNLEIIASKSAQPSLRRGAMNAIRTMHSPETIRFMITMLDSEDPMVQYDAVIGLAEITRTYGNYAPSLRLFNKDPTQYVQLWKDWAVQRGIGGM